KTFLEFQNSEGQKNLIKFNQKELSRIQYSEPRSVMKFSKGLSYSLFFDSLGWIELETLDYQVLEGQLMKIMVNYQIIKEGQLIGVYELQLRYGDKNVKNYTPSRAL
ncbi:MAG: hypothetical protein ACK5LM_06785, partial [Lactovum sp.]